MELHERIIAYVEKHYPLSYTELAGIVLSKGFTQSDLYTALEKVHKSKTIRTSTRKNDIWYTYQEPFVPKPQPHLDWVKHNYPRLTICDYGQPIPFYSPVTDGPTSYYSAETNAFYKQKNLELKQSYDKEKNTHGRGHPAKHFAASKK